VLSGRFNRFSSRVKPPSSVVSRRRLLTKLGEDSARLIYGRKRRRETKIELQSKARWQGRERESLRPSARCAAAAHKN
jgi:hypothetical protein